MDDLLSPTPATAPTPTPARDAYTPVEVAQRLAMSRRSVDRAIARGQIRAVKIGQLVRIPRTELERLLGDGTPSAR